jgi:hypothetical protein
VQRPPVFGWSAVETRVALTCRGVGHCPGRVAGRTPRVHPLATARAGSCLRGVAVLKRSRTMPT